MSPDRTRPGSGMDQFSTAVGASLAGRNPDIGLGLLEEAIWERQGKQEGAEIRFLCPAHDDHNPSARWHPEKATWHCDACKAGGGFKNLAQWLKVELWRSSSAAAKAKGNTAAKAQAQVISRYNYCDENSKLLFQVERLEPKAFRQRRPDAKGGWIYNLEGVTPVLYRLPNVLEQVRQGGAVYLVEGEKDVHSLEGLGKVATCNSMGAGNWRNEYAETLTGAHAILIPDNDEAGYKHMRAVAESLAGKVASLRMLVLPGLPLKGDASDYLVEHSPEDFDRVVEQAAVWIPSRSDEPLEAFLKSVLGEPPAASEDEKPKGRRAVMVRLSDVPPEELRWLWDPYLPLSKVTLFEGDPGLGKTFVALTLAAAITRGWPFLGQDGSPGGENEPANVLYLTAEDGLADTLRPRLDAAEADVSRVISLKGWTATDDSGKVIEGVVTLGDTEVLEQALREHRPRLMVIDPLQAYLGADVDMHRANEVRPRMSALADLAERYACSVLCIRHLSKNQQAKAVYAGLGSIDFAAAARSILQVGEKDGQRFIAHAKSSLAPAGKSIKYEIREGQCYWLGISEVSAEELRQSERPESGSALDAASAFLVSFLADGPQPACDVQNAAKREGISSRTLERAKRELGVASYRENKEGEERGKGQWLWKLQERQERDGSDTSFEGATGDLEQELRNAVMNDTSSRVPSTSDGEVEAQRSERENYNMSKTANMILKENLGAGDLTNSTKANEEPSLVRLKL